jgi:hypothetical protein
MTLPKELSNKPIPIAIRALSTRGWVLLVYVALMPNILLAEVQPCDGSALREGPVARTELRLGPGVTFDDGVGINSGRCFPLHSGPTLIAWVHAYHRVGTRLFIQPCNEIVPADEIIPGTKSGGVADHFLELSFDSNGRASFSELDAPMWSQFANPAFCDSKMAYCGVEPQDHGPVKIHAVIFDLDRRTVVRQKLLGIRRLESDSRDLLARPKWSDSKLEVFFCEHNPEGSNASPAIDYYKFTFDTIRNND